MICSTPLPTAVQPLPPLHDSLGSLLRGPPGTTREKGTPAASDPISPQRAGETDVTLRRPLPLPLSISGYCSELQLTDEPGCRHRGRSPGDKRLCYKLFTSPLNLHNGLPADTQTAPGSPQEPTAQYKEKQITNYLYKTQGSSK